MVRLIQLLTALVVLFSVTYRFWPSSNSHVSDANRVDLPQLLKHSKDYDGKAISIRGVVSSNAGILGYGAYRIRQGKDEILIVSTRGMPALGSDVTVTGTFRQAFAINDFSYTVVIER